jgi:hypothetical protein
MLNTFPKLVANFGVIFIVDEQSNYPFGSNLATTTTSFSIILSDLVTYW